MKHYLLIAYLFTFGLAKAQDYKRAAIWYFGEYAGINFNTDPPTPLTDGKVNTIEGCASICDTNGNLLFYTDGATVWNKYHDTMQNGNDLQGGPSNTQNSLIVPKPGSDSVFYIFTTGYDLKVTEVNINGNNGNGVINYKNKLLVAEVGEKQAAVKHANGIDYWLLTHGNTNDLFYAFLITANGVVTCPVETLIGPVYFSLDGQGSLKISNDGKTVAIAAYSHRKVFLYHFNTANGGFNVNDQVAINCSAGPYGVEFSHDNQVLYIAEPDNRLVQYDISNFDNAAINNSAIKIYQFIPNDAQKLQIGLDKRIYLANAGKQAIGVIKKPHLLDTLCEFDINGFSTAPKRSLFGLPDFVTSFFYQPAINFNYKQDCRTNTIDFEGYDTINATGYKWYFVKGAKKDSMTVKSPTVVFADTGNYTVTFIASNANHSDTITKEIYIYPKFNLNLEKDTVICSTPLTLNAGNGQFCYTWQDSSHNPTLDINATGEYAVKVITQNFCTQLDTIKVTVASQPLKPVITRSKDTLFATAAVKYQWFFNNSPINGATQQQLIITSNGIYKVEITDTNGCKTFSDTINIINLGYSQIKADNEFSLYPNSTKDKIFITKPSGVNEYSIEISDVQGKRYLRKQQLTGNIEEIGLDTIAEGVYLIHFIINNQITETHKLIKL